MLRDILTMSVPIPDIVSKTGITYEISKENWTIVSVSTKGVRRVLKQNDSEYVKLVGKTYAIYDIAKLVGLGPKSWPDDVHHRSWEELKATSERYGYRYRTFLDGRVQKMDQHGNVSYQEHTKTPDGYYTVSIVGENVKVHQMMGETRFVSKPENMPSDWTVHHIDNDPSNNHCDNLVWASPEKQSKERRPREQQSIMSCPVIGTALRDITLSDGTMIRQGEDTQVFDNAYKATDAVVGGIRKSISVCINGKQTSHADFTWRTPPSDIEFDNEIFDIVGENNVYKRFVSTFGRMKQAFHNGYSKIMFAKDILTERQRRERDSYPKIKFNKNNILFHRVIIELFFGSLPKTIVIDEKTHRLVVDHIDDDKTNARLGNLQLLTQQENNKKRHLKTYTTSVASIYENKYEYHKNRIEAIKYVRERGYPEATLEELNACLHLTAHMNIPAKLYDRTWIRAHFEN
ncbi:hypothetical protein NY2A_B165R [Paramecium bursaria Chlorella virus NY2A]|uniref:Uncharacterized protein B165R n=1 Tax=Paramecium bursaria Chlorella virus NY2A TaxID=46021 RepID=A7IW40_PBCVN|nr:hypothetical protein NY2A_B165R [Paramecium bursaria Chlorella virus NY2A]ABT14564.1 hypothetical protein NY2A_B165R [Paramecium bursaria Chlorella virus NY2A]